MQNKYLANKKDLFSGEENLKIFCLFQEKMLGPFSFIPFLK